MAQIRFAGDTVLLEPGESVLEGLLRHSIPVPHSCKAGSCGSCMLRATDGIVPAAAQPGFRDSWKVRDYFLACVCRPESDLTVEKPGNDVRTPARIRAITNLSDTILRVALIPEAAFEFRAGQYISLVREDSLSRSYSIASLPGEHELELHVRLIPGGKMSTWLQNGAAPGDPVHLLGPSGECFYVPGKGDQPLLLAGTGTGLAPLYGILRDALAQGHTGPIHLLHGALQPAGLYLQEELAALAAKHPNFRYLPCVLSADEAGPWETGSLEAVLKTRFPALSGWRGFVCGDPAIVRSLKMKLFLSGMALPELYADSFVRSAPVVMQVPGDNQKA